MLDLNLSVVNDENLPEGSGGDESGTSNSSVVNAEGSSNAGDDDTSSARGGDVFAINFDILKVGERAGEADEEYHHQRRATQSDFVTRQLFPVTADELNRGRTEWADLSFNQGGSGRLGEVRVIQQQQQQQVKKSRRGPRSRSSQYRGVTFYRRTGRWESHIWDCGKQVYLGGFDTAHAAARAYDRAAIKFRGIEADINFNISDYEEDMKHMKNLTKEEFVHMLRRQSTGFSRGSSKYRGVTLHKCGRWEARMGQFLGKKAYDKAAIKCNGREAVTNFEPSTYEGEMLSDHQTEGSQHALDLNLGMSTSSPTENETMGDLQLNSYEMHHARKSKTDSSGARVAGDSPFRGLPMTLDHHQMWSGVQSNVYPNYEERTREKRSEAGSSQGAPNWAWQMHRQVSTSPMTMFSAAASSGFSSPATTAISTSINPLNDPNPNALCFASYPMASASSSQYFYQIRHQPPPP